MSLKNTRESITKALNLKNTPVIALHGPWGSGKTHLWKEIEKDLTKNESIKTTYLSCATYSSISALKSATITALLTHSSGVARHGETIGKLIIGLINKKLPKDLQITTNLLDIQTLLPRIKSILPHPSIIVFDDIERAADLDVGDLLGFVTFLVEELEQKILLIMNKDKFTDKTGEKWKKVREKSVSLEIELRASFEDYIKIGIGDLPAAHHSVFSNKIATLKTKNIRTIQHMRRVYDAISSIGAFQPNQWVGLIPSIVLFVALHQEALEHNTEIRDALISGKQQGPEKDWSPAQKSAATLLSQYELGPIDAFETDILIPYLETGHLDEAATHEYAKQIELRSKRQLAEHAVGEILERHYWDSSIPEADLDRLLKESIKLQKYISRGTATGLAKAADALGRPETSNSIIYEWITNNEETIDALASDPRLPSFPISMQHTHPAIREVINFRHKQKFKDIGIAEAISYLTHNDSFGERHLAPFRNTTPSSMEELLRQCDYNNLPAALRFFAARLQNRFSDQYFGQASIHFIEACENIIKKDPDSRLSKIIRRASEDFGIASYIKIGE